MSFGDPVDEKTAVQMVRRFVDQGGTFIDTADVYHRGRSEEVVGKALKGIRRRVVLATKVNRPMGDGPNDSGNGRAHILDAIHASLQRLQTDYVDLYWMHRPDPRTPIAETLETLDMLVKQGIVRYVACSTFPAWRTVEALWESDRRHLVSFIAEQPPFSILERTAEARLFPMCERLGLGVVSWSPLAGGWLAGAYRPDGTAPAESRLASPVWSKSRLFSMDDDWAKRRFAVVEALRPLAADLGASLAAFSVAWVLRHPGVTSPIVGPRTAGQLDDVLASIDVLIDEDVRERVDDLVKPGESLWFADDPGHVI